MAAVLVRRMMPGDPSAYAPNAVDAGAEGADLEALAAELRDVARAWPARLDAAPESVDATLARVVLTVVEFLRRVLEHQAVRRMEGGGLSDDEVERLGLALMRLEARMDELRAAFGLEPEDLNVDLGPLGRLI